MVDGLAGKQGLLDPGAQHSLAHGGAGFIQHPEQGAPLLAAAQGLGQFEVGAGDGRKAHVLGFAVAEHGLQALDALDLGGVEVFQQGCHGKADEAVLPDGRFLGPIAAKLVFQREGHEAGGVLFLFHHLHRASQALADVGSHFAAVQHTGVHQQLTGAVAAKLGDDRRGNLALLELGDVGRAGGDIRKADARCAALDKDAGDVVVFVVLQHTVLDDRAGRDDADDVPLDEALCRGGVLHLLADGYLIALGDELGYIAFVAVDGHAAHGGALLQAALLAGEGQIQLAGRREGVVKEDLVKIADVIKQNCVLVFIFDAHILLHQGREFRHCLPPQILICRFAAQNRLVQAKRGLHSIAAFWMDAFSGSRRRWSSCPCRNRRAAARSWGRRRSWPY